MLADSMVGNALAEQKRMQGLQREAAAALVDPGLVKPVPGSNTGSFKGGQRDLLNADSVLEMTRIRTAGETDSTDKPFWARDNQHGVRLEQPPGMAPRACYDHTAEVREEVALAQDRKSRIRSGSVVEDLERI
eukprot:2538746-Prymnesium_polylepis.1